MGGRLDGEEGSDATKDSIYVDNFALGSISFPPATLGPSHTCSVVGLYDALIYLALRLFKLSEPWLKMMSGLRWLVADSLNHLAHYLLASKLDTLLTSGRVTRLIEAVEEAVFEPSTEEIFRCLQMPLLNKQLTYTLLETVLVKV